MTGPRPVRMLAVAVRWLPVARRELLQAILAEAAEAEPGRDRARWLWGAVCFIVKEGIMGRLRWAAIGGSALFMLWIGYNAIDSGFQGTPVQVTGYLAVLSLLALNIVMLTRRGARPHDVLRWAAIGGSALLIVWRVRSGIDSGFHRTPVQVTANLALLSLLALNIVILARQGTRRHG